MPKAKRIFIIADVSSKGVKIYLNQMPKLAKGLIRLGHDARIFSYCDALKKESPFKSRSLSKRFYKSRVDNLIAEQIKNYKPDIVYVSFARVLDCETIELARQTAPNAVFIGGDGDPWPKLQKNRIETAKKLDILTATNDGEFLQDYRDAGLKNCVFMPNMCDPDIDYRYEVGQQWQSDILWTGSLKHHANPDEDFRPALINKLSQMENCRVYGCMDKPQIGGIDYLYAISGAKIGANVNAYGPVRLCHSDRLTHYLACGTMVLAKRFGDCDLLLKENEHLRYFDSIDEFFELANWYLGHETERKKIADAGMKWTHEEFGCVKIAGYLLELIEKGSYSAPWT